MRLIAKLVAAALLVIAAIPASAQTHAEHPQNGHASGAGPLDTPYAGLDARAVKALSAAQIDDLRAARGLGLALAAELNGYPGPLHALELADELSLTPDQRGRTEGLLAMMRADAVPLGERLIAEETALDRLFAERRVTPAALADATARIGALQGKLRAAHLGYHLRMLEVLTADQTSAYARLRGYE